ncbi:MAG TPA: phage holin family protein [Gemmatimonadaceae bacterium]|nr:phage holin family protein [Gemmatimonadaceae bacterium]
MALERIPTDPDAGIPDLIRQLGDDSKRLVADEVRLAKLEMKESVQRAGTGAVQLAVAFGVGVVMLVALTIFLATLIGRIAAGHMWVGALVTGIIELGLAVVLLRRGMGVLREPSYTFEETRAALKDTAVWARSQRS